MSQPVERLLCSRCLGGHNQHICAVQGGRVRQNSHRNGELGEARQGQTVFCNELSTSPAGQHRHGMSSPGQVPTQNRTQGARPQNRELILTMRTHGASLPIRTEDHALDHE